MTTNQATVSRSRRILLLLIALFALPYGVSVYLSRCTDWVPTALGNKGILLPVPYSISVEGLREGDKPLSLVNTEGRWAILQVSPIACGKACRQRADEIKRLHKALAEYANKARRYLISPDGEEQDWMKQLKVHFISGALIKRQAFVSDLMQQHPGHSYVIDDYGRVVLVYNEQHTDEDLLKDMQRLLSINKN